MKQSFGEKLVWWLIHLRFRIANLWKVAKLILRHGIIDSVRDLMRYPWIATLLKVNRLLYRQSLHKSSNYHRATGYLLAEIVTGVTRFMGGVFFHKDRLVIHEDMIPTEILRAMNLTPFMAELLGILMPIIDEHSMEKYIDICENHGIPADICTLPKTTMGMLLNNEFPEAHAVITSNLPCDGGMASYVLFEQKMPETPIFRLDIPYYFKDQKAKDYFVDELKNMISWLEEHTPGKMDWEKLKEICEERNRMVELELELWDIIRARPAYMANEPVWMSHLWGFNVEPGNPEMTELFRKIVALARDNREKNIPAAKDERYRAVLWNPPFLHSIGLLNWAEETWGITLILDSMSFNRLPFIDTTTKETMLEGLAETIMNGPMARHTRGPAENYLNDIFHMYRHFELDMVWVAGHIGCKNTMALNGMLKEKCREAGVPLLILEYDLSDPRVVPKERMMEQVNHFMENIMKAERVDAARDSGLAN